MYIKVIDIRTAYLTVDQDKDVTIFIRLDASMTEILVKKFPEYRKFVCPRTKTFVGILLKTMYGSINAAAMLYTKIHKKLIAMKFIANGKDDCCFYKKVGGIRINILAYVDDLCFSCSDKDIMNDIIKEFQEEFPEITIQENLDNCEYLGMRLEHERKGTIKLSMEGYIDNAILTWNDSLRSTEKIGKSTKSVKSPCDTNLFLDQPNSPLLGADERETFHSLVGTIQYLSRRARPDISGPTAYLATRVQSPNMQDKKKLHRVMTYLFQTKERKLVINPKSIHLEFWTDAAYGTAKDFKSQSGVIGTVGGAPFIVQSNRQSITARSSTEAELMALNTGHSWALWAEQWFCEFGYNEIQTFFWQDNQSVIAMMDKKGVAPKDGSRHIQIRFFHAKEQFHQDHNPHKLNHIETQNNTSDLMTKGTTDPLFISLSEMIMTSHSEVHERKIKVTPPSQS